MNRPAHGGNLTWAAAIAGCPPEAILDFSASISPLGPPESALAAIQAHLCDLRAYPDPDYQELRAVLGQLHQLPPEWILPGNGSAELLTWAGWDLSQLAETYLVTPAFGDYWRALKAFSVSAIECPLSLASSQESRCQRSPSTGTPARAGAPPREGGTAPGQPLPPPVGDIRQILPPAPVRLHGGAPALLLNNPHNPTGQLFLKKDIIPYLEQFALVVVDEAFMDFLPPSEEQSLVSAVPEFPNLVVLRSVTKFYSLPGLRLGYCAAHPDRLRQWQQRRDPWPVNALAAAAGAAALLDTGFQQKTWEWLKPARRQLFEGLAKLPGLRPHAGAANFLLVESEHPTSQLQQKLLRRKQILIRDCLSFPELGERYFRVAVRSFGDNQRLLEGLAEVLSDWGCGEPHPQPPPR
ncbi:threonine-phosphate decarboxylase CobD [Kamptonema formosum]|uniref:threonine-phosphate decarboxylase CobD n=1 Tax=Kamptonema formosum TaxID=331992 RepID=UPI00034DCF12|nr:threonine-phosphate decarboxylase CobD [Oscillatoria sp. PCC 10802]